MKKVNDSKNGEKFICGISLPSLEYQMTKIRPIEETWMKIEDLEWNYGW